MGKGLSSLQRSILQLAFKVSPKRAMRKADVLEEVWGWKPAPPNYRIQYTRTTQPYGLEERVWHRDRPLGNRERFASELIGGKKKYQSIHASTARSIRSLVERGLLKGRYKHYQPYRITPEGKKVWLEIKEKEK